MWEVLGSVGSYDWKVILLKSQGKEIFFFF